MWLVEYCSKTQLFKLGSIFNVIKKCIGLAQTTPDQNPEEFASAINTSSLHKFMMLHQDSKNSKRSFFLFVIFPRNPISYQVFLH